MSAIVKIEKYQGILPGRNYVVILNGKQWMSGLTKEEAEYFKDQLNRENVKESMEKLKLYDPIKMKEMIAKYAKHLYSLEGAYEMLQDVLSQIADELQSKKAYGIRGDSYGYIPLGGDKWRATDGSEFKATLLELMVDYAGIRFLDVLEADPRDAYFLSRKPLGDQEQFELSTLTGESINIKGDKMKTNEMVDAMLSGKKFEEVCNHEPVAPATPPAPQAPVTETHADGETDSPEHEAGESAEIENAEKEGAEEAKDEITKEVLTDIQDYLQTKKDEIDAKNEQPPEECLEGSKATVKCPECSTNVLKSTGYCMKCKKKTIVKEECKECVEGKKCEKHKKEDEEKAKKKKNESGGALS